MNRGNWKFSLGVLLLVVLAPLAAQQAGRKLPPWTPGTLDIHHISTGRGNSALLILPDGTTLLVDAGANEPGNSGRQEDAHPDGSRAPGEWIARYARHMLAHDPIPRLDYALITHFHKDHMGYRSPKVAPGGAYRVSGITEVAEFLPVRKVIDRDWPRYDYPEPIKDDWVANYRRFLAWQIEHNGLQVERFVPGRNSQIVLTRSSGAYPTFEVRNIASNGEVWTGVADVTRQHFPVAGKEVPSENSCSIAIRVSYGKFDYFTAGDMTAFKDEGEPSWHDIERPVAQATGPVDVLQLNHHGYYDANSFYFVRTLRPRVAVIPIWSAAQPDRRVLRRFVFKEAYTGPRDVFATNLTAIARVLFADWTPRLAALQGHIVVRVEPGGARYRVFVLDNTSESYNVVSIHGPYESH
jgi:beta-lactamase superfamily II metal-dependent hydrolase